MSIAPIVAKLNAEIARLQNAVAILESGRV